MPPPSGSDDPSPASPPVTSPIDVDGYCIAVADINWYTTEHLFRAWATRDCPTLLLTGIDWRNAWNRRLAPWRWNRPTRRVAEGTWRRDLVLPPGWMKRVSRLGMRPMARTIRHWHRRYGRGRRLVLVMTYPHYRYLRDLVDPDLSIYLNVDDYALYWPRSRSGLLRLETSLLAESDLVACVSRIQRDRMRASMPDRAERIVHLPHGAPSWSVHPSWERGEPIPERPEPIPSTSMRDLPRPILGYVGSLEDRVDWALLDRLAEALPNSTILLVGRITSRRTPTGSAWRAARTRCLARPNVQAVGWQPQDSLGAWIRSFDICLIPYAESHPFNQVCCPTKIMDYMGSGRPIVSTRLPECELHHDRMVVASTGPEFVEAVGRLLDPRSSESTASSVQAESRIAYAAANGCPEMASRLRCAIDALMTGRPVDWPEEAREAPCFGTDPAA